MDRFQIFLAIIRDNVSIPASSLIHLTLSLTRSDGQQFDEEETSRSVRVVAVLSLLFFNSELYLF